MDLCRRLADVAVQLAEAAAAAAIAEYAAGATATRRNGPDHNALFIKFSHAARQAILLETRIENERRAPVGAAKPKPSPGPSAEPQTGIRAPGPPCLHHERLDTSLALNPHATPEEILAVLCETVGLPMDQVGLPPPPIPAPIQAAPRPPSQSQLPPHLATTGFDPRKNPEPSLLARIGLEPARRR